MKPGNRGIERIVKAAGYSWLGLKAAWRHEAAFRQESILVAVLAPVALYLGENGVERALLLGSLLMVMVVELLNSAVEAVVDRFGGEQHELSGRAKDMGSAAVFVSLVCVAVVWGAVLL
ncbi:MAG TPA: diacylglycerol kinase [Chromatiales bacterium]|nr:diacylglycerol kinase [Chromatiales bacterium]